MNAGATTAGWMVTSIIVSVSALAAALPVESNNTMGAEGVDVPLMLADCAHAGPPPRVTAITAATIRSFTCMPPLDYKMRRRQSPCTWRNRLAALRSKLYGRSVPRSVSRTRASKRPLGAAPTITSISPRAPPPDVQQSFALRVEVEESQHVATLR